MLKAYMVRLESHFEPSVKGGVESPPKSSILAIDKYIKSRGYRIGTLVAFSGESTIRIDTRSLQAFLGHKNIQHTVRYTELSPDRFRDFWHD
jgi:hypothetical protein